ncbi:putative transporter MCH1 [Neolecta irregularis DAH-3]|uniref:Probable transporter MCH1 n=1 Tax=Neolecta irregularis (strain DAH-3) TaxID=1198029 RepID=A0A1U7LUM4_NEOID|nr:putative transporter MCH1 [Neolecta irregularis DAH-3]|eukprot:OLL26376.1 putative transporter MCH1 [Neolecta irregularis DAH-3]
MNFSVLIGISSTHASDARLSLLSSFLFVLGYIFAAQSFRHSWSAWVMIICFILIGAGTTASYLSGVSAAAKNYPHRRGLAISLTISSFGLSGLWISQLASWFFIKEDVVQVDRLFNFLGILLGVVGIIGWIGLRIIPQSDEEEEPLIQGPLLTTTLKEFIRDWTAYVYLFSLILLLGAGDLWVNTMGTLLYSLDPGGNPANQVSIFAFFSTVSRLLFGALCDFLPSRIPRLWLFVIPAVIMAATHLLIAVGVFEIWPFNIASLLIGIAYGSLFTVAPVLTSSSWGLENFATFWGILAYSPMIGALVFGCLYSSFYDSRARDGVCFGNGCYRDAYLISGGCSIIGILGMIVVWRGWKLKRN